MARTAITPQLLSANGTAIEDITWTTADATNDHSFINDGKTLLLVKNDSAGALDVVVDSLADVYGRVGDETITTGADDISVAGPFNPKANWNQSGGVVYVDLTDDTSMFLAAIKLP